MRLQSQLNVVKEYRDRYAWLLLPIIALMGVLVFRLAFLQLSHGKEYMAMSQGNYVQERRLPALRGVIYDAHSHILANNRPAYNVYVTPVIVKDKDALMVHLEGLFNLSDDEITNIRNVLDNTRGFRRFRELLIKSDISRDQLAQFETRKADMEGVSIRPGPVRHFPYGELLGHLTGYVGKINRRELKRHKEDNYAPDDYIGKSGLEAQMEQELRGKDGQKKMVVDAWGRIKNDEIARELLGDGEQKEVPPIAGYNLVLSLDLDLQQATAKAFEDFRQRQAKKDRTENTMAHVAGSAVMVDVNNGFILAYYSVPAIDPNLFATGISRLEWSRYRNSVLDPLMDKVSQASYFPGSTYKPIGAIAALEDHMVTLSTLTHCNGHHEVAGNVFHCWNRGGHGYVDLYESLRESCDVYYYALAEKLNQETLFQWAHAFGLGEKPGLGLNHETSGLIPTLEWHRKAHGRRWFTGDTLSHIIGQGDTKVSMLQMAMFYAALANGGTLYTPQVVKRVEDNEGIIIKLNPPQIKRQIDVNPETLTTVREGLRQVVNDDHGTARRSKLSTPSFSGKTGTAQVASLPQKKRTHDLWRLKDHGLFMGYAPSDKPQIAIAVMVEHGEHGSSVAPIMRDMVAAWYKKKTGKDAVVAPPRPRIRRPVEPEQTAEEADNEPGQTPGNSEDEPSSPASEDE